jgi:hypothetical protein
VTVVAKKHSCLVHAVERDDLIDSVDALLARPDL